MAPVRLKDQLSYLVASLHRQLDAEVDELPPELGGDLLIENVALGTGQRCRLARDLMPLRRGTCELGPTYILWRSRLGLRRRERPDPDKIPGRGAVGQVAAGVARRDLLRLRGDHDGRFPFGGSHAGYSIDGGGGGALFRERAVPEADDQ